MYKVLGPLATPQHLPHPQLAYGGGRWLHPTSRTVNRTSEDDIDTVWRWLLQVGAPLQDQTSCSYSEASSSPVARHHHGRLRHGTRLIPLKFMQKTQIQQSPDMGSMEIGTNEHHVTVHKPTIPHDSDEYQSSQDMRSRLECSVEGTLAHPSARMLESTDYDLFAIDVQLQCINQSMGYSCTTVRIDTASLPGCSTESSYCQ